jgi:hypothetical protein
MSAESQDTLRRFGFVVEALSRKRGVSIGSVGNKGFGSSALKVNGKIFAMVSSRGSFVVKLPAQRVESLEASGAGRRFDPGHGRLMKEWIALPPESTEDWLSLAQEARRFVGRS